LNFFLLKEWLKYYHFQTDEHSLHSPFLYKFYTEIIKSKDDISITDFDLIETQREDFLKSTELIDMLDLGAGSKVAKKNQRRVSEIARSSTSNKKFSAFLNRIILYFKFKNVLELGTSLGINTAYLAHKTSANITSFEGDPSLCKMASNHLYQYNNATVVQGNIDETLPLHLNSTKEDIDMVYFDANHTYKATINYFELIIPQCHKNSILIFDDIHWSKEMKNAWEQIQKHPQVTASIDIFDAGLIFLNPDLSKQHYILSF